MLKKVSGHSSVLPDFLLLIIGYVLWPKSLFAGWSYPRATRISGWSLWCEDSVRSLCYWSLFYTSGYFKPIVKAFIDQFGPCLYVPTLCCACIWSKLWFHSLASKMSKVKRNKMWCVIQLDWFFWSCKACGMLYYGKK